MKKILFSCLSLALVMMLWAFTQPREKTEAQKQLDPIWYYYDGSGDLDLQENYTTTPPEGGCIGEEYPCGVLANPDATNAGRPDQDDLEAAESGSLGFTIETAYVDLKG